MRSNSRNGPSQEIDFYRQSCPEFKAKAVVTDDVSGLIVSRGKLMINSEMNLPSSRVEALLAHEVGTHLLTYYNGRLQPFQQLYSGLAGYEELQEGLAVLSEYLVDGLSAGRMQTACCSCGRRSPPESTGPRSWKPFAR